MSESPQHGESAPSVFDALTTGFGPISPETQQGILHDTLSVFSQEWHDMGLTAKIFDMTQSDVITSMNLHTSIGKSMWGLVISNYFHVHTGTSEDGGAEGVQSCRDIIVSQRCAGKTTIGERFDEADAVCVANQIARLKRLKADGILPNLTANLASIYDPTSGRFLPPTP